MACTGVCYATPPAADATKDVYTRSPSETITTQDGLPDNYIRAIRVFGDQVWIGTDGGIARFKDGVWKTWSVRDGVPAAIVTAIDIDPETEEVWLGTWGGGLVRLSAGRFDVFDQFNSGLAGNLVTAVLLYEDRVWAASNGGISAYDKRNDAWHLYEPRRADRSPIAVESFALDGDKLCAAQWPGGVRCFNAEENEWLPVEAPSDLARKNPAESPATIAQIVRDKLGAQAPEPQALACARRSESRVPRSRGSTDRSIPAVEPFAQAKACGSGPVSIGVYGPRTKTIALPGQLAPGSTPTPSADLLAIQVAVETANRHSDRGAGPSIKLVYPPMGYGNYGWGLPEDDLAWMGYQEGVVGIVGFLGVDDWLTDLVAFQTRVPVVNIASFNNRQQANPWVFQCLGDQPRHYRRLLDMLFDDLVLRRPAALHSGGDAANRHLAWWREHARRRGYPLVAAVQVGARKDSRTSGELGHHDLDNALDLLSRSSPNVILGSCDPNVAVEVVRAMRARGMNQLFIGGETIVTDAFIEQVGPDAGRVAALSAGPQPRPGKIIDAFTRKYGAQSTVRGVAQEPPQNAYHSLHAVDHLLAAITLAGPDRESVRTALERMSRSINGERHYERLHENDQTLIAWLENGRWLSRPLKKGPPPG